MIAANVSELNKHLTTPIELGEDMGWDDVVKMCPSNTVTRDEHNKFGNVGTGTVFGFEQFLYYLMIDGQILQEESSEREKELFYLFASQPGSKMSWADLNTINNMILPVLKDEFKPIAEKHFAPNHSKLLTYAGNFNFYSGNEFEFLFKRCFKKKNFAPTRKHVLKMNNFMMMRNMNDFKNKKFKKIFFKLK